MPDPSLSRSVPRALRGVAALAASAALLAACGSSAEEEPAPAPPAPEQQAMPEGGLLDWPVDQPGPFQVGYRRWTISCPTTGRTA
jgi:hypothetical protein